MHKKLKTETRLFHSLRAHFNQSGDTHERRECPYN
nr:MAG TPA: hypothetical protein [Caudoviricetes sp.]